MTDNKPKPADRLRQLQNALSRWDTEGGAGPSGPQDGSTPDEGPPVVLHLTNAELAQLRIRVIALENLVIMLLAEATEQQLGRAREMADSISPRPGVTPHPLTTHVIAQMTSLIGHAGHLRLGLPS